MLGHGLAVQAIRAGTAPAQLGVTLNLYAVSPAGPGEADADAARRVDGLANRIFLDPVLRGQYPEDVVEDLREVTDFDHVREGDLATISSTLDMLGVNYYTRYVVAAPEADAGPAADGWRRTPSAWPGSEHVLFTNRGLPVTAMNWEIDAPGLVEVLCRVNRDYTDLPIYVTENGAAFEDAPDAEGRVDDPGRVDYFAQHLRACHQAISEGVPLRGYFAWSLLDNFEWGFGYTKRFGMVYVDYPTQRRTPKASADWYTRVSRRNGLDAQ
jgi:beta-glucosidase